MADLTHEDIEIIRLNDTDERSHRASGPFSPSALKMLDDFRSYSTRRTFDIDRPKHVETLVETQFYTISGELQKNIAFIRTYKTIQELEVELFSICKEYEQLSFQRTFDLSSLKDVHQIYQIQTNKSRLSLEQQSALLQDVESVIETRPWVVADYKWIRSVFHFLNTLVMKWELVDSNWFRYRNRLHAPQDLSEIDYFVQCQTRVFLMDTLWFGCVCTDPPIRGKVNTEILNLALMLQRRTLELVRFVASLNFKVNFKLNPDIREFVGMQSEEVDMFHVKRKTIKSEMRQGAMSLMGQKINSPDKCGSVFDVVGQNAYERGIRHKPPKRKTLTKERLNYAKTVGFHLLELPSVLFKCMEHDFHKVNSRLKRRLTEYLQLYRVFEFHVLDALQSRPPEVRDVSTSNSARAGKKRNNSVNSMEEFAS